MTNQEAMELLYEVAERYERIATLAEAGLIGFGTAAINRE
jgi:hypothetical protein